MQHPILLLLLCITFYACDSTVSKTDNEAEQLAQIYCTSCHKMPDPAHLDKATWEEYVLPRMGYMLGIYPDATTRYKLIEQGPGGALVQEANIFPKEPVLETDKWEAIKAYFLSNAPIKLAVEPQATAKPIEQFEIQIPDYQLSPPSTTLVQIASGEALYLGDAHTKGFYQFSPQLQLEKAANLREGIINLIQSPERFYLTVMGSFSPTDTPGGAIINLPKSQNESVQFLLQNLQRPVHTELGDLNGDQIMDILVCEFGKWTGGLSLFIGQAEGGFEKQWLRQKSGATKAYIRDLNGDRKQDIIALFAQGEEAIFIYFNQGDGTFKEVKVLEFEPSFGSSYFNLFDYNGDAFPDIIYTAGDNADYPPVMKPYHGIHIFENDGSNQFNEVFFYPLNGAYKAIPEDFDQDGDMDIAAISFFPNFQEEEQGFIYLENQGKNNFTPYTLPENHLGRWITMDSGDLDGDGDDDLVLGSLAFEVVPKNGLEQTWKEKGIPFIVLWNK
jgi:hypothetical protein